MDIIIATGNHWFKYENEFYKIVSAGIKKGMSYANVEPANPNLEEEIKERLSKDKSLKVYLASGYICFPEDYLNDLEASDA